MGISFDERRHGADVIGVEVRGQQDVDFFQARLLGRGKNALGIAIVGRTIRGIDEHRLAARRDDESGGAALGVDPVNFQIARC